MSDLTVGYAAMLEQFHPTEAVRLTALAEEHDGWYDEPKGTPGFPA